jgi:outer membrane protein TolC
VSRFLLVLSVVLPLAAFPSAPARSADADALETLVLAALESNLELRVERIEPIIAARSILDAQSQFDPLAQVSVQRSDSNRFANNVLETSPDLSGGTISETRLTPQGSLQGKFVNGAEYELSATTPVDDTDHPLRIYDRAYTPSLSATITQPLMRDAGTRVNRLRFDQALAGTRHAWQGVSAKVLQVVRDVESAYWALSEAQRRVDLMRDNLATREERAGIARGMASHGLISDSDARMTEINAEERRADLGQAQADLARARVQLREVLGGDAARADAVEPALDLPSDPPPLANAATLVKLAVARRPEIQAQQSVIDGLAAEERLARNDQRMRFDALGSLGYTGLSGSDPVNRPLQPLPPGLQGKDTYLDAFQDMAFSWMVGFQLSIPIRNRAAQARLGADRDRISQERIRLELLKSQIGAEVESTLQETIAAWGYFQSSLKITDLTLENLRDEVRRRAAGLATDADVLDARDNLASAQDKLLQRHLAYALARSRLQAADGGTFDVYHLQQDPN